jgi:hypothetical protein
MSAGQSMDGGVLSSTVITCTQVLELSQSSVAVQVLLIVYSCGHAPEMVWSAKTTRGAESQLSVAVDVPVSATNVLSVHSTVTSGAHVSTGGVLSSIEMV